MVSQMIVVVAGEQGKDQPPPQLAEICGDVVAVLADAVSQQRVGTSGARREADEAGAGQKGNPTAALPVKPRNHRHPPAPHLYELVIGDIKACLTGKCEGEDLS